jgi:uncharacterized protein
MADPGFYPHHPSAVELRETHASRVFLAGRLAYKVRKPVRFPFLDYRSLQRRRSLAFDEVRLNAELAPGVYRGVRAIVAAADGKLALGPADAPAAIEYAVEMVRLPEERTAAALLEAGGLRTDDVWRIGRRIAAFHAVTPAVARSRDWIVAERMAIEDSLRALGELAPDDGAQRRVRAGRRFAAAFLDARSGWLAARADAGRVRDCHGDLRAEHVVVEDEIRVFDRIEFDPRLRATDVAADIGFLAMDLEARGGGEYVGPLLAAYRGAGGDPGDDALVAFLGAARAWVRAKVDLLRVEQLAAGGASARARDKAAAHLRLADRLCWRARAPLALLIGGVAASGKTTLAEAVSAASGFAHLSSDIERKRLAGLEPTERAPASAYTNDANRSTYARLGASAARALEHSGGVVVDATFRRRADRDAFVQAYSGEPRALVWIECFAPPAELVRRARQRAQDAGRTSDATADVVLAQVREREDAPRDAATIRTDRPLREILDALCDELDRRLSAPAPRPEPVREPP